MESDALISKCIDACEERQADNIYVYDVRGQSTLADYYLICTGRATPHLRAIQQSLSKALKEDDLLPRSIEGTPESQWILIDYNDVLIHIFSAETRARYNLEGLLDADRRIKPSPEEAEEAS